MIAHRLYGSIVALRNSLFDHEVLRARRLRWPVVSVGNISVGGSGKTPFVIMLGELLAQRGILVDVLSRGYRRSTTGVLQVNPNGFLEEFGDEPLLIARKLGCPVFVGENRHSAGLEAEDHYPAAAESNHIHLLDDGFQHRQLHRDFDIVLLNDTDLDDKVLPSGRLREPITALSRADAVVVNKDFPAENVPRGNFELWRIERMLDVPELNVPVIAFCGIARANRFFSDLRNRRLDVREEIAFRDHHRYSRGDVEKLLAMQERVRGSRLVTTEKDVINLGEHTATLDPVVTRLRVCLTNAQAAADYILQKVAERRD
ncbi:MAG TPA: tetraacyldisaccharide 4'-kinase [Terriglobales bacterium]|nr:tetraacyldisaccharide 4'-kinase [Terriglobales bacterium]